MRNYFCGWYFRLQSDNQTLALIPSVHKIVRKKFCEIQLISDADSHFARFSYSAFQRGRDRIQIGQNQFGRDGIRLSIHTPTLHANGSVLFGPYTPIKYDIMGPFRYVPRMQCRHSVYSMRHTVDGELEINGIPYFFRNADGYSEGDRGYSFPKTYAWTQCAFPNGSLMLSVADIPLGGFHFTGIIGIILLEGKEYRLATYLGAKAVKIENGELVIRQGRLCLTVRRQAQSGHPLHAPIDGAMVRTIHEHPSCRVYYRLESEHTVLLELDAARAAFEYEY